MLLKCRECRAQLSPEFFREKHRACRDCERRLASAARRLRKGTTGLRQDPTRKIKDVERKAIKDLYKLNWNQVEIGTAFNVSQPTISKIINEDSNAHL